jgi:hypothetical protein
MEKSKTQNISVETKPLVTAPEEVKKEAERNEQRLAGNARKPAARAPAGPAGFSMKDRGEYDPDEAQRVIDDMLRIRT